MEQPKPRSTTIATGLAMFSMFFGAGNFVFPLALGLQAQGNTLYAMIGMAITTIGVPFLGLVSMTLFNGNYRHFFERIGEVPGFIIALIIMGLIGPFGAIPRCITLSHSTLQMYFSTMSLSTFSIIACAVIFLLTFRKNQILTVLGYVLTPLLLLSLAVIIVKGIFLSSPDSLSYSLDQTESFLLGLKSGYQTMDLLGAFFFSSVVLDCLEGNGNREKTEHQNYRRMIVMTLKASLISASLLGIIYFGLAYVAAFNNAALASVATDQLVGALAIHILGPYASIIAISAVALACLTTAIALSAVFAEFLHNNVTLGKLPYIPSLLVTLVASYFVSTLSFSGIAAFLVPILQVCYPALIVLSIVNIAHKLHHFQPVKAPVAAVFLVSLVSYFL